jgi:uncharacterized repeat protein (TIGR01451 family)
MQSDMTLGSLIVPVTLYLERNTNQQRTFDISLSCQPGGPTTFLQDQRLNIDSEFRTFDLSFSSFECPAGSRWELTIANKSSHPNQERDLLVHPVSAGNRSQVILPSENVINVDSISYLDTSGNPITSAVAGQTIYIRAVVSDPFGSFDIAAARIDLEDPDGIPVISGMVMEEVEDSGAATKTFEYSCTLPALIPTGDWTIRVEAEEGTEGEIFHTRISTLQVFPPPNLTVAKMASGATAAPGQVVTYTVQVLNTGLGPAINVVLDDRMSPYTAWGIDSFGAGISFQFVEGDPPSGLLPGIPEYSDDQGDFWNYEPTSGNGAMDGYDATVTNWRIPMDGEMAPGGRFTLRYRVMVK